MSIQVRVTKKGVKRYSAKLRLQGVKPRQHTFGNLDDAKAWEKEQRRLMEQERAWNLLKEKPQPGPYRKPKEQPIVYAPRATGFVVFSLIVALVEALIILVAV